MLKDHKEGVFLEIINQLEAQKKSLSGTAKQLAFIAIMAVEGILKHSYGRTEDEINELRRLS